MFNSFKFNTSYFNRVLRSIIVSAPVFPPSGNISPIAEKVLTTVLSDKPGRPILTTTDRATQLKATDSALHLSNDTTGHILTLRNK